MDNVAKLKIEKWAKERGLDKADPNKQILKLGEEYGELCDFATKDKNIEIAKDAVGDMYVVLVILCMQLDIDFSECIEMAYQEIRHRKGKIVNGSFVKESDL